MDLVRLFKVGRHLGKQAVRRNPDVDGKPQGVPHPVAERTGHGHRRAEQRFGPGHIKESLVDAVLFHIGAVIIQNADQRLGILHIPVKIRRHHRDIRAFGTRGKERFPRADAVLFGWQAFGQHNAVALFLIPADHSRDGAQVHGAAFAQGFERAPG